MLLKSSCSRPLRLSISHSWSARLTGLLLRKTCTILARRRATNAPSGGGGGGGCAASAPSRGPRVAAASALPLAGISGPSAAASGPATAPVAVGAAEPLTAPAGCTWPGWRQSRSSRSLANSMPNRVRIGWAS
eukprot:15333143-Alexandrium_andersonii.AAC.1